MLKKQLSVFMENRPGLLARTCAILSENRINLIAIAVHDTVDNAVLRLVCNEPTKALLLLEQEEFFVLEQDVVVCEMGNEPGELTRIAQILAQADINISYAYCTAPESQNAGCLVLKTDEPDRANEILSK